MSRRIATITLSLTFVCQFAGSAGAQSVPCASLREYAGSHPWETRQRALRLALENRKAVAAFHRDSARLRRTDQQERLQRRIKAFRAAVQHAQKRRLTLTPGYSELIDPAAGTIDWPDRLQRDYSELTSRLNKLHRQRATTAAGVGCDKSGSIRQKCNELLARLKRDLRQNRNFSTCEYIRLKHLVIVLRDGADAAPAVAVASQQQ